MADNLNLSDIAAITEKDGFGGGSMWIIIFLIFAFMGGFGGYGNRQGEFGQYATAASQNEILLGQKFDALGQKVNQIGDGICSSTYALNNTILGEGRAIQTQLANCCCENQRNIDSLRFDMSNYAAQVNATTTAQTQKILDTLCENKMAEMQSKINSLELQNAMSGVVRYPMASTFSMNNPYCGCGSAI